MNREILFKAKRLDNGEWVEGYYVYVDYLDEHYILASCKEHDGMHGMLSMKSYKVHPNTLCQFTGLTDKNGNKIWENDIVVREDRRNGIYLFREQPKMNCKVGDMVYFHWKCSDETTIVHRATVKEICMGTYMTKPSVKYKVEPLGYVGRNRIFYISDFGFCIFLTKEEAEAKLKEME